MAEKEVLLHVEHLVKHFPIKKGIIFQRAAGAVHAVDDVTFDIYSGETLGLVGESGCGKSTTGRTILQLHRPTSGKVIFEGEDLAALKGETLRRKRRDIQMIFQDPYASLNPRMTVGRIIGEPMEIHGTYRGAARERRVAELLSLVGLNPAFVNRYPHEFSGGQRQRIGVARALALEPKLIVCDDLGARRLDPGAGGQPAGRLAEGIEPDVSLYRARLVDGPAYQRPDCGHVSGDYCRAGGSEYAVQ